MRKHLVALVLVAGMLAMVSDRPAAGEDKGIVALQQSVSLLMSQLGDLQKSFNTQVGVIQGLVSANTDSVNKLSSGLDAIQRTLNGNQVVAAQQQTDIGKQFQAMSDSIAELQAHLGKMDTTLAQIHQMQQTIPSPSGQPGAGGDGGAAMTAPGGAQPAGGTGTDGPGTAPAPGGSGGSSPVQLYTTALTDFQNNSPNAQAELANFIRAYPNDPQVPDATYYLGTIFMQNAQYNEAIDDFSQLIERYPDNAKTPLAELNKGMSLASQGNKAEAISELRALIKNYPDTEARREADIELKKLTGTTGRGR